MHQIYYLATSEKSYSKGYGVEPHRVLCGYMLVKLKKQGGRYTEWLQPVLVAPVSKPKPKTETSQGQEIKTRGHQSQTANLTFPNDRLLKSQAIRSSPPSASPSFPKTLPQRLSVDSSEQRPVWCCPIQWIYAQIKLLTFLVCLALSFFIYLHVYV